MATKGLILKYLNPRRFQFGKRTESRRILILLSGLLAGGMGLVGYRRNLMIGAEDRLQLLLGWEGEYAQDVLKIGSPPLNMNLPPHLRLDMKSYLDNAETVISPPPAWDKLHPYSRDRYRDVFLDPIEHKRTVETSWHFIEPWGANLSLEKSENYVFGRDKAIKRCEEAVLHNQRPLKRKTSEKEA
eukprot:TRINITY_DN5145_c3_g1_i1.p1 TRINITY_DN5145_c3_g1~~TRINITY_DN5145_c3_g1_i1.p1  ORF type:complete len:218 (+),score=41.69 TRINITY_DN5145_c3_g1_i1:98-655(+)